jgi:hypothetical protein
MDSNVKSHIPEWLKSINRGRGWMRNSLNATSYMYSLEIELFDFYVNDTEKHLEAMHSQELAYIQEQIDAGAEDINDSGIIPVKYFFRRVRYSHVIYMVSLLESFLKSSCKTLEAILIEDEIQFSLEEKPRNGRYPTINQRREHLERLGKFKIPTDIWSVEIRNLIKLRNSLVHNNGSLSKSNSKNLPGVKEESGEYVIEAEYISSASVAIKSLIQFVEKQLLLAIDSVDAVSSRKGKGQ